MSPTLSYGYQLLSLTSLASMQTLAWGVQVGLKILLPTLGPWNNLNHILFIPHVDVNLLGPFS